MSEEMELEGEWVMGWPDRKRARVMPVKMRKGGLYLHAPQYSI